MYLDDDMHLTQLLQQRAVEEHNYDLAHRIIAKTGSQSKRFKQKIFSIPALALILFLGFVVGANLDNANLIANDDDIEMFLYYDGEV